ncbi:MAG: PaaI family thioesterase [Ruminiclostridium sp.]|nr:PaaI family thioesterase [Ruminiclostridium sp.]
MSEERIPTIEEVREFFKKDRYATENGAVIDEIGDNYAVCSIELCEIHLNAMGSLMGAVPFTLSDFAFAVAANWKKPQAVSITSSISFIGTPKGKRIIATANCVKDGRSTCTYLVTVKDELDNLITQTTITGYKLSR